MHHKDGSEWSSGGASSSQKGYTQESNFEQAATKASFPSHLLGGGISPDLLKGRVAGRIEKLHLVTRRVLTQEARERGITFLDLGTDSFYPFFKDYTATKHALQALSAHAYTARWYPSSFGLMQLREEAQRFFASRFHVHVDLTREIMVSAGASQAFDALSRAFRGEYFLLPALAISTIHTIAIANGAKPLRVPPHPTTGLLDLAAAANLLEQAGRPSIRFMYLNYPHNPTGQIASRTFFEELVAFAREFHILLVHDMDSWYLMHHSPNAPLNILEIKGAKDVAITILSFSKEFGIPGIRIGLVAGNAEVINTLRIHNSEYSVMLPEPCQYAAIEALKNFQDNEERKNLSQSITEVLQLSIEAWQRLGWPAEKIYPPHAGYKYLLAVPPAFKQIGEVSGAELFDFYIAKYAYVKLSTSRAFNEENSDYIRVILMQEKAIMEEVFKRLSQLGIHYDMEMPPHLPDIYASTLQNIDLANL
ncbi:pyridoxal phosphate-dependent aminotransferase [Ktedonosporobacter rubrisoli]|nr:pyridoxal phosphate-dependent aminotransferase [Ktedonosporobacter rubrisoli]